MKPMEMAQPVRTLPLDFARLRRDLSEALARAGEDDPVPMLQALARRDVLTRFARPDRGGGYRYDAGWREILPLLAIVGGVDLATARLLEGHLNALQLVALYGTASQQARLLHAVEGGGLTGVWGADGAEPARLHAAGSDRWTLSGSKRYASGAGLLAMALVPITDPQTGEAQLLLLDVAEPGRVDLSDWDMRGMRRSLSGSYRLDGVAVTPAERVGAPDDYPREPFFVGGIWRCAAAQLGAIEAMVATLAADLARLGRDGHSLQAARIGKAAIAARTARLWIEDAAARVEGLPEDAGGIEDAVAASACARLVTEEAAMTVIDLVERGLGLASFSRGHPVEALSRDLAVYIRQANPDAVLLQHAPVLAGRLVPDA